MERYNVCLINDSFPPTAIDGVANATKNYADIINNGLGNASVVTPYYPETDDISAPYPIIRYPSLTTGKNVGYRMGLPFSASVLKEIEKTEPQIIHSHCPITSTMLARSLREVVKCPLVFTYHTKFDIDIGKVIKLEPFRDQALKVLVENISACDEVWTVSNGAGENLRKIGYQGDYIVIPNGVDFTKSRVSRFYSEQICSHFDLPSDIPVFFFVGRLMWYKGIGIILDALKILLEKNVDFRMVFVGTGADKNDIISRTDELGLSKKVFFEGAVYDREIIKAWYCRANLFLFPSSYDTNGLVVREAAACALPSVLIKNSCAAEGVTDGVNGFLIDENAEAMSSLLMSVCDDFSYLAQIGENAQRDLYISWEDAVYNAYQRYGVVIENYRNGLYPTHENLTDEFYTSAAMLMGFINRETSKQIAMKEELSKRLAELEGRVKNTVSKVKSDTRALADEVLQYLDRYK